MWPSQRRLPRELRCSGHEPAFVPFGGLVRCIRCGEVLPPGHPGLRQLGEVDEALVIRGGSERRHGRVPLELEALPERESGIVPVERPSIGYLGIERSRGGNFWSSVFERDIQRHINDIYAISTPVPPGESRVGIPCTPPSFELRRPKCQHRFEFRQLDMTFVCALCDEEVDHDAWSIGYGTFRDREEVLAQNVLLATARACQEKDREEWAAARPKPPGIPGRSLEEMTAIWLRDTAWWDLRGMIERREEVAGSVQTTEQTAPRARRYQPTGLLQRGIDAAYLAESRRIFRTESFLLENYTPAQPAASPGIIVGDDAPSAALTENDYAFLAQRYSFDHGTALEPPRIVEVDEEAKTITVAGVEG